MRNSTVHTSLRYSPACGARVALAMLLLWGGLAKAAPAFVTDDAMFEPGDCGDCDTFSQFFGSALALDGDTAIVGASHNDNALGHDAGAAWVYERLPSGEWSRVAKLMPSDGRAGSYFGWSVALQGNTAFVGAMGQSTSTTYDGAVYVFVRDAGGHWIETAKLTASDPRFQGYFGASLAVDGYTLVVGSRIAGWIGAAYVFVKGANGAWTQQAKLTGSDVVFDGPGFYAAGYFGWSVDIAGDTVIVGHPLGDGGAPHSGAAYAFVRDRTTGIWREQGKLTVPLSPNADDFDRDFFGSSVAIAGDTAVVGAPYSGVGARGAAYVFQRDATGSWLRTQQLATTNFGASPSLGASVAIEGDRVAVSAPGNACVREINTCGFSGSVHMFGRDSGGQWVEEFVLGAHETGAYTSNGLGRPKWGEAAVAISGARVLAGLSGYGATSPLGAAFLFHVGARDTDLDGIVDDLDNCPTVANPDQTDSDADGLGDVCDDDDDNDGLPDSSDNCRLVSNPGQQNTDGDSFGDACDGDVDGDSLDNEADNCPYAANPDQTDTDRDRLGDECDPNDDNDARPDSSDNCPAVPNDDQLDLDADGIGDVCDADIDGDGAGNTEDNCAIDFNPSQDDTDHDGQGDVCDADDDDDGRSDASDNCPLVPNAGQVDADQDGVGDVCDGDLDGDNVGNVVDNCPYVPNSEQVDYDSDGVGDACDEDRDGDGVNNASDSCAATPIGDRIDADGCTIAQLCPCEGPSGTVMPWRNHGKYVSCVAQAANRFQAEGLITSAQHDSVVSTAGQSSCGSRR